MFIQLSKWIRIEKRMHALYYKQRVIFVDVLNKLNYQTKRGENMKIDIMVMGEVVKGQTLYGVIETFDAKFSVYEDMHYQPNGDVINTVIKKTHEAIIRLDKDTKLNDFMHKEISAFDYSDQRILAELIPALIAGVQKGYNYEKLYNPTSKECIGIKLVKDRVIEKGPVTV